MRTLDFYFDFMSPFAYLAHCKLPDLAHRYGYEIAYHPIDLPQTKLAAGNTGPPNVKIPNKIRYLRTDLDRWAARYDAALAFPGSLDTAALNRGFFFAQPGERERYVSATWQQVWGKGGDPTDKNLHTAVADAMDWNAEEFIGFMASDQAVECYAKSNSDAHSRGIFGAPIMTIGDDMWWGNDRLDFLEQHMQETHDAK